MSPVVKALLATVCDIAAGWVIMAQIDDSGWGRDATDGEHRSGLGLRTDHGTGCQYLVTPWGGITPRLDRQGQHMCGARP